MKPPKQWSHRKSRGGKAGWEGARLLPRSPARSVAAPRRRGRTPPSKHRLKQGRDVCSPIFTGAYELPPADSVICCAALLTSQGAGALSPDPFCTTSQGFLLMPSPLMSSELPPFPHNFLINTTNLNMFCILLSPRCEDSAQAQDFGAIWMQITYRLLALTNTIPNQFILQHLQVDFRQTRRTTEIQSALCV